MATLLVAFWCAIGRSDAATTLRIESANCSALGCCATLGGTVELVVTAASPSEEPLGAFTLDVAYDPALLRLATVSGPTQGPFATLPPQFCEKSPGVVTIAGLNPGPTSAPSIDLARLTLTVIATAPSATTLSTSSETLRSTERAAVAAVSAHQALFLGSQPDSDCDRVPDPTDNCPHDPDKTDPGRCGCGTPEGCNDSPVANPDAQSTDEDTPLAFPAGDLTVNDSDANGDGLTVESIAEASNTHGTATLANGMVSYNPAKDFNGTATFGYTVGDGHGGTASAEVTVTVRPVNDPPVAARDFKTTDEDTPLSFASGLLAANDTDVDGDALSVLSVTGGPDTHGTANLAAGTVTYAPALNFNGTATFEYAVSDGHGGTTAGTVEVTVNPVNDPPVAVGDSKSTDEDMSLSFDATQLVANDTDVDGDALAVVTVTGGPNTHGTVSLANGFVLYTPASNFNGTATFEYSASDGHGGTATGSVTVTVVPVNDPPVAVGDNKTTNEDAALSFAASQLTANDTDVDGDALSVASVAGGPDTHGTVSLTNGSVTYTPALNFNGTATFTYSVSDGHGGTTTGQVTVVINPVNDAPVPGAVGTKTGQYSDPIAPYTVTAIDVDNPCSQVSIAASPLPRQLSIANNGDCTATISGILTAGAGTVTVTYSATDSPGASSSAAADFTITKENVTTEYTGDAVVSGTSTSKAVSLRANVIEDADGSFGTAVARTQTPGVIFRVCDTPLDPRTATCHDVVPASTTPASAPGTWSTSAADSLKDNVYLVDIRFSSANLYFTGPDVAGAGALVVASPSDQSATGGGWIEDPSGSGLHGNLGFTIRFQKSGQVQGQSLYIYREAGKIYRFKSNSWDGLGFPSTSRATFQGKCNLTVSDAATGTVIDSLGRGNLKCQWDVTDNGEPGSSDIYSVVVRSPDGTQVVHQASGVLKGGNIQVKGTPTP
jgi:Big-like domain-containing protein